MGITVWEPRLAAGQAVLLLPIPLLLELLQIAYAETWKEALVPRSATQLAKFTKHFFQLHFDHFDQKSVSITPSSSTTGLCRSPRCLPRIPLTTSIMGGQLKLKPFVFGFYKFCLGTPPKLTYPQKMIVGSGRLFILSKWSHVNFQGVYDDNEKHVTLRDVFVG